MQEGTKARLVLVDGTVFEGRSIGATGETGGEVVFNTSMTGYQEILTDPSYRGQIVTMTCPEIGNYGTNSQDQESSEPQVEGFVVRSVSVLPSNWRASFDGDLVLAVNPDVVIEQRVERRLQLGPIFNELPPTASETGGA